MGQIVIDIPVRKKRRFFIDNAQQAELLITALETAALRIKADSAKELTRQEMEDLRDGLSAERSLTDMRRTGISYSLEEVRKELGIT